MLNFDFSVPLRYAHPMSVEIKIIEQIAIVSFSKATSTCGIFESESLFNALQNIEHNENIDVVILKNVERYGTEWDLVSEPRGSSIQGKISNLVAGIDLLSRFRQPVIATAGGKTIGPGMELFVSADIRLCDSSALFGLQGITDGFLPLSGAGQRLIRAIGRSSSLRLLLLGELISSDESLRVGLVSSLSEDTFDAALELAKTISTRGPLAIRAAKEALYRGGEMTLAQGLRYELDLTILLQSTSDRAEGVSAFMQKRQPHFEGK
jgi:enoyl-CoA hydratase